MPETCITFGAYRARVTIEDEEVPHFAMHVNPEKKEVSCWIASEEGKVRESFSPLTSLSFQQSRRFRSIG